VTPSSPGASPLLAPAARNSDPATSHLAAALQTPAKVRDAHRLVLELLNRYGPLTDFDLAAKTGRKQTSIGKRRHELCAQGLVRAFDHRGVSDTGTACTRWVAA
jgi:hypothetical protein